MATYKTPIKIRCKIEGTYFVPGKEFEMTVKRATELEANIKKQKGFEDFKLERTDNQENNSGNNQEENATGE